MSDDLVVFTVRCGKSLHELKIKTPLNVSEFIETLKNELKLEDIDELVILCPTSEGKMMELQSDNDIEFLKKNKLCYNAVSKEIYCSVELVVILIPKENLDNNEIQIKILANKIGQLSSQFEVLSQSLTNKIEENSSNILESIKMILSDRLQTNSNCSSIENSIGEPSSPNVFSSETKTGFRQQKTKKQKEKLVSITALNDEIIDSPNSSENLINPNTIEVKDIDTLLGMLAKEGYTNTIQNIIVLKRFDNNFDKAINYLKSNAA